MSIKIYHQIGHNPNWNIESFTEDKCGEGLIFSPVHQTRDKVESIDSSIKKHTVFDPQYYLPNSQKKKLSTYPFFPEVISGGFTTIDYPLVAIESARQCISFQMGQGFEKIIIPARYIDQMITDYIERQEEYSILPFFKVIGEIGTNIPIYITLPLTSHMIQDEGFRTKILNWVTSFPELAGVYVLITNERATKQIQSSEFLTAYLDFLMTFRTVGLEVISGHTNTESLLYALVDEITLTFGAFENTRMFSLDKFVESEEERRGPKARIYLPGLLNWVQFNQAREIKNDNPALWAQIYVSTKYGDQALASSVEPYFNQPQLYKHYFMCYYEQIRMLSELNVMDRYALLREWIKQAISNHNAVTAMPLDLDHHGNGMHLQPWLDSINHFYRKYLKV